MIELPPDLAIELRVGLLRQRKTMRALAREHGIAFETLRGAVNGRRPKAWRMAEVLRAVSPYLPTAMQRNLARQLASKGKRK